MTRYRLDDVRRALREHWGFTLHRGGEMSDGQHDGRWDKAYSRTGFVIGGELPGLGHGYRRYPSLAAIVRACGLAEVIAHHRGSR